MAERQWRWVGPDGFEYTGSLETLKLSLSEGRLPATTLVSRTDTDEWTAASEVGELAEPKFEAAPALVQPLPAFQVEDEAPTMRDNPVPEPAPAPLPPPTSPPAPPPVPAPAVPPEALEPPTARVQAVSRPKSRLPWIVLMVAFGAFALGGVVVLAAFLVVGKEVVGEQRPVASVSASASAAAPPAAPAGCSAGRATLISRPVFGKIPLEIAAAGRGRLAVAFARAPSEAELVVLSLDTLDKKDGKRQPSKAPLSGARPVVRGDAVELVLDSEEVRLRGPRSIFGQRPLRIGIAKNGIAKSAGDGEPEVVWPLAEKDLTAMRVETHESIGHFVALRGGGQSGRLLSGWLSPDGSKKTELLSPELSARAVGTPAPALGPSTTLLLVAAKPSEGSGWQLHAGKAPLGQVPSQLSPIALGGEAASRIAPSAAASASGGWLLQWTEGPEGAHVVKVVLLDAGLAPIGNAVTVSPADSDSGQGRVWADGERSVSFFLVSAGDHHELWAAPLGCR